MSIEWSGDLLANLREVRAKSHNLDDDMAAGADKVLTDAVERVPKRSGDLASTGSVKASRGGDNTAAVVFDSVYARWVHEHLTFHHPVGGQAKFLETAMLEKGHDAMNDAAERFWRRL